MTSYDADKNATEQLHDINPDQSASPLIMEPITMGDDTRTQKQEFVTK